MFIIVLILSTKHRTLSQLQYNILNKSKLLIISSIKNVKIHIVILVI